jgi:glycosyltransferase involved in cell wall biosynthesis
MPIRRVAFVGNSLPRRCGIATFTTDLHQALVESPGAPDSFIVAMSDHDTAYAYPTSVRCVVRDHVPTDYIAAANMLNAQNIDVVCLQHEFGIYGGEAGRDVLLLLERLRMPVVTTLHTVLAAPSAAERAVLVEVIALSTRVVVMVEKGRELLRAVYGTPNDKIEVIAHGIPASDFVDPAEAKQRWGFAGRSVILTFGLLSPGKGLGVVIAAMPAILKRRPDAVYLILGATHPNLVRREGEAYRDGLAAQAASLGVAGHVVMLDRFVDRPTLLDMISMSDVYVTPYVSEAQMTSGTLAYSFGLGKAVVSTPYWHARELLADGRGVLVPFNDVAATAEAIADLLLDDPGRQAMRQRAYDASRAMTWGQTALRYRAVFAAALAAQREEVGLPEIRTPHLLAMCDDTGLYQHADHNVADRAHGYCVDDNARALLLACTLGEDAATALPAALTNRFAAFVGHAFNPDTGRFRNFMGFDRQWREEAGSEDSHARTLWSLGVCAATDTDSGRRQWALALFQRALPAAAGFTSPRAWAFTLLGAEAACALTGPGDLTSRMCHELAMRLALLLETAQRADWVWFEDGLAYDNARLCQALLASGRITGATAHIGAGLRSLRWLMGVQTGPLGVFRPVGTMNFGHRHRAADGFDQQPVEAAATISACLAAWRATDDGFWLDEAGRAMAWFFGANDLGIALVDPLTGGCRDGLHPDRANANMGGESAVSYLLSLAEMRQAVAAHTARSVPAPSQALLA